MTEELVNPVGLIERLEFHTEGLRDFRALSWPQKLDLLKR
jgi:hypothetical protein